MNDTPIPDALRIDPKLLACARELASEDGQNPEYDRALVELVIDATPGLCMDDRHLVEPLILNRTVSYTVSVMNNFDATSPADAIRQMIAWLDDHAATAGYRAESSMGVFWMDAEKMELA